MSLAYVVSLVLLFITAITRPDHARCGDGYHLDGVRADGRFRCRPRSTMPDIPVGAREQVVDDPTLDARELESSIHCTNGQEPIVVNERIVACQQRH